MPSFEQSRSSVIAADPARVHALIDDFHTWPQWSPWEDIDPDLERSYSGPDRGVGARYQWRGNNKAGEGSMQITQSTPERIVIELRFLKPFPARHVTTFTLEPRGAGTEVTWTMTGRRNVVLALLGRLFFDKAIAKDFDRGLVRLREAALRA